VIAALAAGDEKSIEDILPSVYDDVPEDLHGMARRSLLAHLIKLEADGSVVSRGERWQLRERDGAR